MHRHRARCRARPAAGRGPARSLPAGLLLVLIFLTVNVLVHGPMVTLDQHIRQTVQGWAHAPDWRWLADSRHAPARLITDIGRETVAVPVLAVVAVVLAAREHTLRPLLVAATGMLLLLVTVIPAKIIIARPGPGTTALAAGRWGYFPSGHTSTACVCYSIAVFLLIAGGRPGPPGRARWPGRGVAAGRSRAGLVRLSLGQRRAGRLGTVRAHRLADAARPTAAPPIAALTNPLPAMIRSVPGLTALLESPVRQECTAGYSPQAGRREPRDAARLAPQPGASAALPTHGGCPGC